MIGYTFPQNKSHQCGFALVIALGLMGFIVLLMLSLTTFVRVSVSAAAINQERLQAETNAQLAVMVALGNLQKAAGPDQRVTAVADILDPQGYSGISSTPLASAWTGVWDSREARADGFLGWLVSAPDPVQSAQLNAVEGFTSSLNDGDTVELVGSGTLGDLANDPNAPLARVEVWTAPIPGQGTYAFWVGDEGGKARLDLPRPSVVETTSLRARYDFMQSQRNAMEVFGDGSVFPDTSDLSSRLFSSRQLLNAIPTLDSNLLGSHFHDYSLYSKGVLADVNAGGLKKDLSWLFERPDSVVAPVLSGLDANSSFPGSHLFANNVWPSGVLATSAPTWQLLRSFYRFKDEPTPLASRRQTATTHGLAPVVSRLILNRRPGVRFFQPDPDIEEYDAFIRLNLDMRVILWNPYNVPIAAQEYDLEYVMRDGSGTPINPLNLLVDVNEVQVQNMNIIHSVGVNGANMRPYFDLMSGQGSGRSITFRISSVDAAGNPIIFQPGESILFAIDVAEEGEPYSGENVLMPQSPFLNTTVWLEHPNPIAISGPPQLNGFRFKRLWRNNQPASRMLHIGLKRPGTGGNNAAGDYYAIYTQGSTEGNHSDMPDQDVPDAPSVFEDLNTRHGTLDELVHPNDDLVYTFDVRLFSGDGFRNDRWMANYNARANTFPPAIGYPGNQPPNNPFHSHSARPNWHRNQEPRIFNFTGINSSSLPRVAERPSNLTRFRLTPFEIPTAGIQRLSIADFQHANVNPFSASNAYLIGNSLADMRMLRGDETLRLGSSERSPAIDGSYLLNELLWDRFFLSTLPEAWTQDDLDERRLLPNARMRIQADATINDVRDFDNAAANILMHGGFNINSTSVDAWKSLLAGRSGLEFNPVTGSTSSSPLGAVFSRLARPGSFDRSGNENWQSYRELNDTQLRVLAEKIVEQVKLRGPFLTLAEFVNRQLDPTASSSTVGSHNVSVLAIRGALALALQEAEAELTGSNQINSNATLGLPNLASSTNDGSNWSPAGQGPRFYLHEAMLGSRNESSTNWLTQGDILQGIGGAITARSDTFIIRGFGSSANPVNPARVYCEAVVQRVAAPVTASAANPNEPDDPEQFGRQFQIVSFRWLNADEI
jgi:hypothetical protein